MSTSSALNPNNTTADAAMIDLDTEMVRQLEGREGYIVRINVRVDRPGRTAHENMVEALQALDMAADFFMKGQTNDDPTK